MTDAQSIAVEAVAQAIAKQRAIRIVEEAGGDPSRIKSFTVDGIDREDALAAIAAMPAPSDQEKLVGELDREEIAETLFDQRQPPHSWEDAEDADPESDAGTLRSICYDDADAVIALITRARTQAKGAAS